MSNNFFQGKPILAWQMISNMDKNTGAREEGRLASQLGIYGRARPYKERTKY